MKIYKLEPQFNVRTGKPMASKLVKAGDICDLTGQLIEHGGQDGPMISTELHEIGGSEETWYYHDTEIELPSGRKVKVERGDVFNQPYIYILDRENFIALEWLATFYPKGFNQPQRELIVDGLKGFGLEALKKTEEYHDIGLAGAMQLARVRMIRKVVKSGEYTLEQLDLTIEEE